MIGKLGFVLDIIQKNKDIFMKETYFDKNIRTESEFCVTFQEFLKMFLDFETIINSAIVGKKIGIDGFPNEWWWEEKYKLTIEDCLHIVLFILENKNRVKKAYWCEGFVQIDKPSSKVIVNYIMLIKKTKLKRR